MLFAIPVMLLLIGILFFIFVKSTSSYGEAHHNFFFVAALILFGILGAFWLPLYIVAYGEVAELQRIRDVEVYNYIQAIKHTKDCVVNLEDTGTWLTISVENQGHSAVNAERLLELRTLIESYNRILYTNRRWNSNIWTACFIDNIPEGLKPIVLSSLETTVD